MNLRRISFALVWLAASLVLGLMAYRFYLARIDAGWSIHDGYRLHQNLMSLVGGDGLRSAYNMGDFHWPSVHYFRHHAYWWLYPLSLIYRGSPHVEAFLLWQTLSIALAVAVVGIFGGTRSRSWIPALLLATSAPFAGLVFSGVHVEATAITAFCLVAFLALFRWDARARLWWRLLLGAALIYLLFLKEDLPFLLFGWAVLGALLDRERRRFYVGVAVCGLAAGVIDLVAIRQAAGDEPMQFGARFGWLLGGGDSADFGGIHQWDWRRGYVLGALIWLAPVLVFFRGVPLRRWLPTLAVAVVVVVENTVGAYLGHLHLIGHYQLMAVSAGVVLVAVAVDSARRPWAVALVVLGCSAVSWSQTGLAGWLLLERSTPVMVRSETAAPRDVLRCLERETPWTPGQRYAVPADLMLVARPVSPIEDLDDLEAAGALPDYVLAAAVPRFVREGPRAIAPEVLSRIVGEYYRDPAPVCGGYLLFTRIERN